MSWLERALAAPPPGVLESYGLDKRDLLGTWVDNDGDVNYCFAARLDCVLALYRDRRDGFWSSWYPSLEDFQAHARLRADAVPQAILDYLT